DAAAIILVEHYAQGRVLSCCRLVAKHALGSQWVSDFVLVHAGGPSLEGKYRPHVTDFEQPEWWSVTALAFDPFVVTPTRHVREFRIETRQDGQQPLVDL